MAKSKRRGVLGLSAVGGRTINRKTRSEDPEAWKSADEQFAAFMDAQRKSPAVKFAQQSPSMNTIRLLCRAKGIPLDGLSVAETAILGIMLKGSPEAKSLEAAVAKANGGDKKPILNSSR